ncbi:hypothetical protein KC318_g9444 [Hortaea werneckii]|nr:hypothetical protein KC334_g14020 [Hortaea werneckii]KAI7002973.1 hypothetical protein KC355_g9476 [Hortaea werneckii]KAI7151820.1 hypothetical protein KC324_g14990 [Hortaea werneckii]KAI7560052.1 hypothetical protein KC316_g13034 [Hortaea werneckii]KAI7661469.1 hypothetical protein KC318_g9444 [Hortaea werneckii]
MPLYEVQHYITLTVSQKDELAEAITKIHSTKFSTPRMFVNVHFTATSTLRTYVGGKPRQGNHIRATPGPPSSDPVCLNSDAATLKNRIRVYDL